MRIFKSHPLISLVNGYLVDSPQPSNISYLWNFGSLLGFCLVIQIVTGVTLAMQYDPSVLEAFNWVITWFKLLSKLPGTANDFKKLIDRSTSCGPSGPQGPSGGNKDVIIASMVEARKRHDDYRKRDVDSRWEDWLDFGFENLS